MCVEVQLPLGGEDQWRPEASREHPEIHGLRPGAYHVNDIGLPVADVAGSGPRGRGCRGKESDRLSWTHGGKRKRQPRHLDTIQQFRLGDAV